MARKPMTEEQKAKRKAYMAKYRAENKERIAASYKAYVAEHREKRREYDKKWRDNNKEVKKERDARYNRENAEKVAQRKAEYYYKNLEKERADRAAYKKSEAGRASIALSNARRRERVKTELTPEESKAVKALYAKRNRMNKKAGYIAYHVDHIIPLAKGGKTHPDNLQILTAEENLKKSCKII